MKLRFMIIMVPWNNGVLMMRPYGGRDGRANFHSVSVLGPLLKSLYALNYLVIVTTS